MGRDHTVIYLQNTEEHFQLYQSIRNIGNIGGCFLRYFKKTFNFIQNKLKIPPKCYSSISTLKLVINRQ